MTTAGRFITFEGSEGVGKSTQIASVQRFIESAGIPLVVTREQGGTDLSEAVRGLLLDPDREPMHEDTELLLMFAARAEHLRAKIEPALRAGQWVLCDRFTDATFAYQGGGRGISADRIETLEQWVHAATQPDLTLLLDVPVEVGLARARARARAVVASTRLAAIPANAWAPLASTLREMELSPCTSVTECNIMISAGPT